jgi:hypothetical protein
MLLRTYEQVLQKHAGRAGGNGALFIWSYTTGFSYSEAYIVKHVYTLSQHSIVRFSIFRRGVVE